MGAAATAAGSALPPAQLPDDVPGVHVLRASEQTVLPQASRNARSPAPPLNTAGGRVEAATAASPGCGRRPWRRFLHASVPSYHRGARAPGRLLQDIYTRRAAVANRARAWSGRAAIVVYFVVAGQVGLISCRV